MGAIREDSSHCLFPKFRIFLDRLHAISYKLNHFINSSFYYISRSRNRRIYSICSIGN